MKVTMETIALAGGLSLALLGAGAGPASADDVEEAEELVESCAERCKSLEQIAAEQLDDGLLKGTRIEAAINEAIGRLKKAIDVLREKLDDEEELDETRPEARAVRGAAKDVEKALAEISHESEIWDKWRALADEIEELAKVYDLSVD